MIKIYLSYTHEDFILANEIKTNLIKQEYMILENAQDIKAGQSIKTTIKNSIYKADLVIVLITKNSENNHWIRAEINTALGYFKSENRNKLIFPICFEGAKIPPELASTITLHAEKDSLNSTITNIILAIERFKGELKFEREKSKIVVEKVKKNLSSYVSESKKNLKDKEIKFKWISYVCYSISLIAILASISIALYNSLRIQNTDIVLSQQIQININTIIITSLIIALSRFTFIMGKSFMVESLRNGDRIHAISFGEFYLNIYEDNIKWEELKEAFQHWNIDMGSSFINQKSGEYDPELIQKVGNLIKAAGKK